MIDAFLLAVSDPVYQLLALLGVVTFITRIGGWLVLARFSSIPAPVQAGLEAVPAAVITTIVVPPALSAGTAEFLAVVVAGLACFRFSSIIVILLGLATLVGLRALGL